ncbi:MAG: ATP-binding protein, partial [Desulfuromonadales bacterium]|nr:ATP-binding protein [Desulfuromonadales bacterium]
FSPAQTLVEVYGGARDDFAWISVQDQGVGIPKEKQQRIFDKFYRIDGSNTAPRGLGLGLHIVRNIVEAHGGEVLLKSQPGKGATITFRLPLVGEEAV